MKIKYSFIILAGFFISIILPIINAQVPIVHMNNLLTESTIPVLNMGDSEFVYGEMWNKSDDGFEVVDLISTDVYAPITKLNEGKMNGFTILDGNMTSQVLGLYKVTAMTSVESAGNGEHGMKLFVNNIGEDKCYNHEHTQINYAVGFNFDCLIRLYAGDIINVRFDDHVGTPNDLTLLSANINLVRIAK